MLNYKNLISKDQQIGFLTKKVRDDGSLSIEEKAEIVDSLKRFQIELGIFPYDRFVKYASNHKGSVFSSDVKWDITSGE